MRATSTTSRSTVSSLARRASSRARARGDANPRAAGMRDSGRGRRPDDSTDARGTVFDAHDDGKLGRRDRRPVLRVGARAQTLPPPNEKIVTEKKMAKVCFESSAENVEDARPSDGAPEIALIGRSNVGKSSLLNLMTFGRGEAAVSAKPGTTVSMNHYVVDNKWRLVDLPGYGYAEAQRETIEAWDAFTKEYFVSRENLAGVLLLVDASIPPSEKDATYADWLIENDTPFTIVFTKCDRNKPGAPTVEENKAALRETLESKWHRLPSMISTSSVTTEGREEVLKFISSLIVYRRQRNDERKKAKRREKVRAMKEEKYEAKGKAMAVARRSSGKTMKPPRVVAAKTRAAEDDDEWDDEEEEEEDWEDESSFTMNVKSKGAKTIQDMIRAELDEIAEG
jgi:GTP-binding protein|tara:strand:- start:1983 stop:3173 length:1191 start_codon:yes stop_codon:yes gene_type:complete